MYFFNRQILSFLALCLMALLVGGFVPNHANAASQNPKCLAGLMPEVRLRKIHIVRPDLIPYPIVYEIDC